MGRVKKQGKRARGIQSKKGYLYITISRYVVVNGEYVTKREWIATKLRDTPENIKIAKELRDKMLSSELGEVDRSISISDYIDKYLEEKKRDWADTTYSAYLGRAKYIKKFFTDKKLKEISQRDIEEMLDDMFTAKGLKARTVKDTKDFIKSVFAKAFEDGVIVSDPAKKVKLSKQLVRESGMDEDDLKFFSYKEAIRFLQIIESHELYEFFYVALFFGMRRSETLGLKWGNIDLENKLLYVRHTVTKGTKINRLNATKSKASHRPYSLTDGQVEMFKGLKAIEDEYRRLFGKDYIQNDYVFRHPDGSLYYPDTVTDKFKEVIRNNPDLPQDISLRGLRTSCVSILVHQGKDIKEIQEWVGHSDPSTTLRYYAKAKSMESKLETSEAMDELIPCIRRKNLVLG